MASRPVRSGSSLGVRWADAVRAVDPPQVSPRSWCPPITLVTPAYPFSVKPPYRLTVARRLTRSLEIIAIFEQRGHQLEGRPADLFAYKKTPALNAGVFVYAAFNLTEQGV